MTTTVRSRLVRLRTVGRQIHLWVTLLVGLPVAIVSAVGLPISYWGVSDTLFAREFFVPQPVGPERLSLDALIASARAVPNTVRVDSISFSGAGDVAVVSAPLPGMDEREIAVAPASGSIVGVRDRHQAVVEWLYSLHTRLLLDRVGADHAGQLLLVGLAVSSVALIVSGIVLWWPRRFTWSSVSPKLRRARLWQDLHTKAGLYSLPALTAASITTVLLSFAATRSIAYKDVTYPAAAAHARKSSQPPGLEEAAQIAAEAAPDLPLAAVMNVSDLTKPLLVGLGDDALGYRWVDVDRSTGAVLEVRSEPSREGEHPGFLIGLHQGHRFGKAGQLLFALSSLIPLLLYATGLYIWWQRRKRSRWTQTYARS